MNTGNKLKGYLLGAVAAATYGMNPLFALPLYSDGMDSGSVLFFRYVFAIPIVALMLLCRGRNIRVGRKDIVPLAVMGVIFAFSSLALFRSYLFMGAGIASTLLFVYPVMVALIAVFVFKEKTNFITILSIVAVIIGIALLYNGGKEPLSLPGTVLVFLSSLSYAIYIVCINHSRLDKLPTLKVTFWVLSWGCLVFIISLILNGGISVPTKWWLWINLVCLALFPTAISLVCTTGAIQIIGPTPAAILGALEPVTALLIGIFVFNEQVTPKDIYGMMLIIIAVTIVIAGNSVSSALLRFRKMFPSLRKHGKNM